MFSSYKIDTLINYRLSCFLWHTQRYWITATTDKFLVPVQCIHKLSTYKNLIESAPPPRHCQNHCFYFHWEIKQLRSHCFALNCFSAKTRWKKKKKKKTWCIFKAQRGDYFPSMLLNSCASAEWIPHIAEHSRSMLSSRMLTPLCDLRASVPDNYC